MECAEIERGECEALNEGYRSRKAEHGLPKDTHNGHTHRGDMMRKILDARAGTHTAATFYARHKAIYA